MKTRDRYRTCRTRYTPGFVERYDEVPFATRDCAVIHACKASTKTPGMVWVEDLEQEGSSRNIGYAEAGRFNWAPHIVKASWET